MRTIAAIILVALATMANAADYYIKADSQYPAKLTSIDNLYEGSTGTISVAFYNNGTRRAVGSNENVRLWYGTNGLESTAIHVLSITGSTTFAFYPVDFAVSPEKVGFWTYGVAIGETPYGHGKLSVMHNPLYSSTTNVAFVRTTNMDFTVISRYIGTSTKGPYRAGANIRFASQPDGSTAIIATTNLSTASYLVGVKVSATNASAGVATTSTNAGIVTVSIGTNAAATAIAITNAQGTGRLYLGRSGNMITGTVDVAGLDDATARAGITLHNASNTAHTALFAAKQASSNACTDAEMTAATNSLDARIIARGYRTTDSNAVVAAGSGVSVGVTTSGVVRTYTVTATGSAGITLHNASNTAHTALFAAKVTTNAALDKLRLNNGASLTNLNGTAIASGTVAEARIASSVARDAEVAASYVPYTYVGMLAWNYTKGAHLTDDPLWYVTIDDDIYWSGLPGGGLYLRSHYSRTNAFLYDAYLRGRAVWVGNADFGGTNTLYGETYGSFHGALAGTATNATHLGGVAAASWTTDAELAAHTNRALAHGISTYGTGLVHAASAAAARTILGLGSAATNPATAAQGAKADTAIQVITGSATVNVVTSGTTRTLSVPSGTVTPASHSHAASEITSGDVSWSRVTNSITQGSPRYVVAVAANTPGTNTTTLRWGADNWIYYGATNTGAICKIDIPAINTNYCQYAMLTLINANSKSVSWADSGNVYWASNGLWTTTAKALGKYGRVSIATMGSKYEAILIGTNSTSVGYP